MVKVQIYIAENMEWGYRVFRGSRVIIGPKETYKLRGGVRRAVQMLAEISQGHTVSTSLMIQSELYRACVRCLDAESDKWAKRTPKGYGSKPSPRYRR